MCSERRMFKRQGLMLFVFLGALAAPFEVVYGRGEYYVDGSYRTALPLVEKFDVREGVLGEKLQVYRLKVGALGVAGKKREALGERENYVEMYSPTYERSVRGLSGLVGLFASDNVRVEGGGYYESFNVVTKSKDKNEEERKFFAAGRSDVRGELGNDEYAVFRNEKIEVSGLLVNVCYGMREREARIVPYGCIGGGTELLRVLGTDVLRHVYQSKLGVSLRVGESSEVVIEGYYRGGGRRTLSRGESEVYAKKSDVSKTGVTEKKESTNRTFREPRVTVGMSSVGCSVGLRVYV